MRSGRHDGFNLEFGRIIDERGVLIELSFNIDGLHVSKHLRIGQPVASHGIAPVVAQKLQRKSGQAGTLRERNVDFRILKLGSAVE